MYQPMISSSAEAAVTAAMVLRVGGGERGFAEVYRSQSRSPLLGALPQPWWLCTLLPYECACALGGEGAVEEEGWRGALLIRQERKKNPSVLSTRTPTSRVRS